MGESIPKHLSGKLLTAVLTLTVVLITVWYWRMPPEQRETLWMVVRNALIWLGVVAALPWAMFFVVPLVMRLESNIAAAGMLLAFLAADIGFACYLAGGLPEGGWQRVILLLGWLCAAIYNYVVCESLARRAEDSI